MVFTVVLFGFVAALSLSRAARYRQHRLPWQIWSIDLAIGVIFGTYAILFALGVALSVVEQTYYFVAAALFGLVAFARLRGVQRWIFLALGACFLAVGCVTLAQLPFSPVIFPVAAAVLLILAGITNIVKGLRRFGGRNLRAWGWGLFDFALAALMLALTFSPPVQQLLFP